MAVWPPQPPDNNSIPGFVKPTPRLLNVIVGLADCATNLYHISYVTPAPAQSAVIATPVIVAPYILPAVFTQLVDEVKVTALPQTSLAGGGSSTQIVNAAEAPVE